MNESSFVASLRITAATAAFGCALGWGSPLEAADRVIVLDSAEARLTLIDESTRKVVGNEPTGKEPHHLLVTPDKGSLIIANSVSNNLMLVDPHTGKLQRKIDNIDDPYQMGFSPDHKWFVTEALRLDRVDIYRYDGQSLALADRIPLAKTPSHMTFSSDSQTVFVTLRDSGELAAIELASHVVRWRMHVGDTPASLWMTPGDRYLLVAMAGEDGAAVVDWRNRQVVGNIQTGRGPRNFRTLADGRHVAVSNGVANTISIIDCDTLTKVDDITGLLPGPDDMELSADGRYLWVTFRFARRVGVIDMSRRALIETIPVGRSPHGIFLADRAPALAPNAD
jgi:DNA-binding beta-propeller fold protein YncE